MVYKYHIDITKLFIYIPYSNPLKLPKEALRRRRVCMMRTTIILEYHSVAMGFCSAGYFANPILILLDLTYCAAQATRVSPITVV